MAAFALGTAAIPAVDMVVGPGNAYVEEAKRRLFGEVGIESLAGPTRAGRRRRRVGAARSRCAWDLLAQVEHGPGSQSVLVSPDPDVLAAIEPLLPAESGVVVIEADTLETALAFVNAYAPEHLQLMVADPDEALEAIHHAGAIFVGPLQRDGLRRLHRRLQPHPADRRPQPLLVGPLARGVPAHAGGGRAVRPRPRRRWRRRWPRWPR